MVLGVLGVLGDFGGFRVFGGFRGFGGVFGGFLGLGISPRNELQPDIPVLLWGRVLMSCATPET